MLTRDANILIDQLSAIRIELCLLDSVEVAITGKVILKDYSLKDNMIQLEGVEGSGYRSVNGKIDAEEKESFEALKEGFTVKIQCLCDFRETGKTNVDGGKIMNQEQIHCFVVNPNVIK